MSLSRERILDTARVLITGDRQDDYGSARDNFARIGKLWEQVLGTPVTPGQVGLCMALVKVARLVNSPDHADSFIDAAGYIALAGELATSE